MTNRPNHYLMRVINWLCCKDRWPAMQAAFLTTMLILGAFCLTAPVAEAQTKMSIRVTDRPFVSSLPFHIAQDEGFFDAENLNVTFKKFGRASESSAAFLAKEVDTVCLCDTSSLNFIVRGLQVQAIWPQTVLRKGSKSNGAVIVRRDLYEKGIRDPKDLKGKKIAWIAGWSLFPYAANRTMEQFGLDMSKDMQIKRIRQNPAKVAAMQKHAIDAGLFTEPWATIVTSRGVGVPITYLDYPEGVPTSMIAFKTEFLRKNRKHVLGFLRAYIKAVRNFNRTKTDPQLKRKYAEKYAKAYGLSVENMIKMHWPGMSQDGEFSRKGVQEWMDWVHAGGSVKGRVTVQQWYDPSFTAELKKTGFLQ